MKPNMLGDQAVVVWPPLVWLKVKLVGEANERWALAEYGDITAPVYR